MTRRRSGLGSGIDALIPNDDRQPGVRQVPIASIRQNSRQPRTQFEEAALDELAASIREHGVIQPLIVSERAPGAYELVAGERRWRAAQRAGLERVPVIVRETSDQQLLELALIENVQRADLNPLEEAQAFQALKDEFGLSDDQIARRLGLNSRVTVANTRRLLRLPEEARAALLSGAISAGHGRALLKIEDPAQQLIALRAIVEGELSVRAAERLGELAADMGGDVPSAIDALRARPLWADESPPPRRARAAVRGRSAPATRTSADDQAIARELETILATPVSVTRTEREVRVMLTFHTEEKFQEFFELLGGAR
ncbi:MAG TPA: ParB/RepB/Spo0J family partition protein [Roseiflexaceae bacterium]|nr:ParB/RepB/Spo0J family partition protein [Roseiflexaceae bacterium]